MSGLFGNFLQFFLISFLIGAGILFIWFFALMFARDIIFNLHHKIFQISKTEFNLTQYKAMAIFKLTIVTIFLIPYIALKLII